MSKPVKEYCTLLDNLLNSKNERYTKFAYLCHKLCTTGLISNPKRRVTIFIPKLEDIKDLEKDKSEEKVKEIIRKLIVRKAFNPEDLKILDGKTILSNNKIEYSVSVKGSDITIDGVKVKYIKDMKAFNGEVYETDKIFTAKFDESKYGSKAPKKQRGGDNGAITMLIGPVLRRYLYSSYKLNWPEEVYGLSQYYSYPNWLLSSLICYLHEQLPQFYPKFRQFLSLRQPLSSLDTLLQFRSSKPCDYIIGDEILRGFLLSKYYLNPSPQILVKAKDIFNLGTETLFSIGTFGGAYGGQFPLFTNVSSLTALVNHLRYASLNLLKRQVTTEVLLAGILDAYRSAYANNILIPEVISTYRQIGPDVAKSSLITDLKSYIYHVMVYSHPKPHPDWASVVEKLATEDQDILLKYIAEQKLSPALNLGDFIKSIYFIYLAQLDFSSPMTILAETRAMEKDIEYKPRGETISPLVKFAEKATSAITFPHSSKSTIESAEPKSAAPKSAAETEVEEIMDLKDTISKELRIMIDDNTIGDRTIESIFNKIGELYNISVKLTNEEVKKLWQGALSDGVNTASEDMNKLIPSFKKFATRRNGLLVLREEKTGDQRKAVQQEIDLVMTIMAQMINKMNKIDSTQTDAVKKELKLDGGMKL